MSPAENLVDTYEPNTYYTMMMDAAGPEFVYDEMNGIEEAPNPEAQRFYDMLAAADNDLWLGCENHTQLSLVARLMALKSEHHFSERCFDQFTTLLEEFVPKNNMATSNFYSTKKLLREQADKESSSEKDVLLSSYSKIEEVMTRGGGSHDGRSRAMSSMASAGGTVDDSVGHDGTDTTGEESRTVDSRQDAWLETVGRERILAPSNTTSRAITAIFKRYLHPTGFAWKKKEFRWIHTNEEVQLLFWKKCTDRYRDMVYHMKKDDYLVGKKPDFIRLEDWPAWVTYWQAEKTQEKFRLAKKNHLTEPDGPGSSSQTHHGGARCVVDHMRDLFRDKCDALVMEWRAEGREVDMGEIFRQVLTPDRKGRAIGMGNMAPVIRRSSGAGGSSSSSS
ncbi:hypothetical protein C2S53_004049 [Perilla frutescens var. hirtella]|uniref:Uncharacterized protein n=1 Tax=Perilla frutescens var. hirtella TaxID=608512 RepID=A0AAD4IYT7_PERFH|nr:hypothetical protein C2S53_004049 [Perilla frutescens var. hirtella]